MALVILKTQKNGLVSNLEKQLLHLNYLKNLKRRMENEIFEILLNILFI